MHKDNINSTLEKLSNHKKLWNDLNKYSQKFERMLDNIKKKTTELHLIYSQFRTLEGIGIFKILLEKNNYEQLRVVKNEKNEIDINLNDKPKFILYTGTENDTEKEIFRNIFNGDWDILPENISKKMKQIKDGNSNKYGKICNIFMITSSGAEGISLKNVRNVHIMEPYWHPVRRSQVIGRSMRICSHHTLPKEERNVDIYDYLITTDGMSVNNTDFKIPEDNNKTSDEFLYELSKKKENIINKILDLVTNTAIDCNLYNGKSCFKFDISNKQNVNKNIFSYVPDYNNEEDKDENRKLNIKLQLKTNKKEGFLTIKSSKNSNEFYYIKESDKEKFNKEPIPIYKEDELNVPFGKLYKGKIEILN